MKMHKLGKMKLSQFENEWKEKFEKEPFGIGGTLGETLSKATEAVTKASEQIGQAADEALVKMKQQASKSRAGEIADETLAKAKQQASKTREEISKQADEQLRQAEAQLQKLRASDKESVVPPKWMTFPKIDTTVYTNTLYRTPAHIQSYNYCKHKNIIFSGHVAHLERHGRVAEFLRARGRFVLR